VRDRNNNQDMVITRPIYERRKRLEKGVNNKVHTRLKTGRSYARASTRTTGVNSARSQLVGAMETRQTIERKSHQASVGGGTDDVVRGCLSVGCGALRSS
jgi:hypothetical protein